MQITINVDDNEYLTRLIFHFRIQTIARELATSEGKDYDKMPMLEEIKYWNRAVDIFDETLLKETGNGIK